MNRLCVALLALVVAIAIVGCSGLVSADHAVPPILKVATNSLPGGTVQQTYSASVAATGGRPPYGWSISSGQLAPGLALSTVNGDISGTPFTPGQFNFTVQVNDSSWPKPQAVAQTLSLNVATSTPPLLISTTTLPNGTLQLPYTATLAATGGTTPYSWSIVSGSLPTGLALSPSTGGIAGAPTQAGGYLFTVRVTDSAVAPQSATRAINLTIAAPQLQITTNALPAGVVGVNYSATLAATNGVPPYTWSISGGQLPTSLALQAPTGQISGTPTAAGRFGFLVQVNDSSGQVASSNFIVNIATVPAPTVGSVSPNSGPTSGGTSVTITGTNFQTGATVFFGGVAALPVTVSSATQIQAVTPAHNAGTVDITIQNPNGQLSTLSSGFVYTDPSPTVASVLPNSGGTTGGTPVMITGTNFLAGALVFFGTVPAPTVTLNSTTQIQALTPASAAGTVDVTVRNPDAQVGVLTGGFTYTAPPGGPPSISSVSPNSGTPGAQVTINGTNFGSGATVAFGGTNAASTVFVNATQLTAPVPAIAMGVVDVKVMNLGGASATLPGGFTVTKAQSLLAGMTPASFTVPSGWTLVTTQDFESGTLPANQGAAFGFNNGANGGINGVNPHTGTKSLQGLYGADGDTIMWVLNEGVTGSFTDIYLSYYDYVDANALYANSDYYMSRFVKSGVCGAYQDFGIDAQFYTQGIASAVKTWLVGVSQGSTTAGPSCQGQYQNQVQPQLNINAGVWRQYEFWFHPSTTTSGTQTQNLGDGEAWMWVDGQLFMHNGPGVNLNGIQSMANAGVRAGGVITSFSSATGAQYHSVRCNPFSACPGTTPGTGAPMPFHRYIDDIIVIKK